MGRVYFLFVALALLLVVLITPAFAATCTVRGQVTDAAGRPVEGADVTLFDGDRSEITSVKSDASGHFAFVNVNVNTGLCAVRVFYNDKHQTYTSAGYFTEWYQASGQVNVPLKDTQLQTYHKATQPASSSGSPVSTPGFTLIIASLVLVIIALWKSNNN